jgi:hypothetical protein
MTFFSGPGSGMVVNWRGVEKIHAGKSAWGLFP